ncbi:glycoside hydrolase family 43 protein [soil metagenome]
MSCLVFSGCFVAMFDLHADAQSTYKNIDTIHLADPTIFYNKGTYYLYGTVEENSGNGFIAYTSKDMQRWEKSTTSPDGYVLKKGEAYGTKGFWAPQVFQQQDSFYLAYVADENIAIATSASPAGPFMQKVIQQLEAPVRQIDPFVFMDTDGKKYLYHVRLTSGNKIFVAEMEDDLSAIKPATLKECITATDAWENTAHTNWPVTEGPSVLKHNGLYYLFYTANDFRNPDYAVGYATSTSPLGPWKKYAGNPIISKNILGVNGTGHGDFVMDAQHQLTYVFHTHFSATKPTPRRTAIIKLRFQKDKISAIDKLVIDRKSFRYAVAEVE